MIIWNKLIPSGVLAGTLSFFAGGRITETPEKEAEILKVFMEHSEMYSFVLDLREMDVEEARQITVSFRASIYNFRKTKRNVFAAVIHSFPRSYNWLKNTVDDAANIYVIHHIDVEDCLGIAVNELWIKVRSGTKIPEDLALNAPAVFLDPENPEDVSALLKTGVRFLTTPAKNLVQFVYPEKTGGRFVGKSEPTEKAETPEERRERRRREREQKNGKI